MGGKRFSRITSCGKALQSQRELGHYSSAHSLNRINSSGVLKDNEHANYCLGGTGAGRGMTAVFRCTNASCTSQKCHQRSRSQLSKEMLITGESCQWLSNHTSQSSFAVQGRCSQIKSATNEVAQ